ncbi:MAG TPA: tetratricopeptide repeat protein [Rhabdochlamydiaceae bacterium]|jgi:tetratricopeptide (TPR) repeat protein|nr:tetratricopeptide repeat protein [Rhabdochlamydiaceae bacterium]
MLKPVHSSSLTLINPARSYKEPIVVALAMAAIGLLMVLAAKPLFGRVILMIAERLNAQGCEALEKGKFDVAIQKFTLALQQNPNRHHQAAILINRALAYKSKGVFDGALADFTRALGCSPPPDILFQIYANQGRLFDALKKDYKAAITNFNEALKVPCSDKEFRVIVLIERARAHGSLEDYEKSLADFNAAFALKSQNPMLQSKLLAFRAQMKIRVNQTETVLEDLKDALACQFKDPQLRRFIYVLRGDYYSEIGDDMRAVEDYSKALLCTPYDEETYAKIVYKRGWPCLNLNRQDEALQNFTQALNSKFSNDPFRAEILIARARVYIARKQFPLAASDLTRAIDLQPVDMQGFSRFLRAAVYTNLGRFSDSINDYTAVLKLRPDDNEFQAETLDQRGLTYWANNQRDLARADFEKALSYKPTKKGLCEKLLNQLRSF